MPSSDITSTPTPTSTATSNGTDATITANGTNGSIGDDQFQPSSIVSDYPPPKTSIDPDTEKGWLRRLLPLLKAHPWTLGLGIAFSFVSIGSQVFVPYISLWAIDAADEGNRGDLTRFIIMIGVLALIRAVSGIFYRSNFFKLAFHIDSDLRSLLYSHLTRLSFAFYDRTVSGEVVSRANSDIRSVQILFAFAPLGITQLVIFVIALGLMLTIHIPLTLVALLTIPFVYYLGIKFRNIVFPLSWITQSRIAEIATIVDENTNGAHIVKAFSAEKEQLRLLARAAKRVRWSVVETINTRARYNPAIEALPKLGMAAVLGYGGWLVIEGQITVGVLFAFSAYVIMSLVPFRMLGFLIMQARRSAAAAERVYEVLDTPLDISDSPDAQDLVRPSGQVRFENVSFTYPSHLASKAADIAPDEIEGLDRGDQAVEIVSEATKEIGASEIEARAIAEPSPTTAVEADSLEANSVEANSVEANSVEASPATIPESDVPLTPEQLKQNTSNNHFVRAPVLKGISFNVEAGETIAIVGSTGSGKSTIARLLARFYDTTSGRVLVDEKDIATLTQSSLRHHVGIVFDDPFLFSMSLADNIAFAKPSASMEEITAAAKSARAHKFITQLPEGYDTIVGERGYTLSGGQRQRVALARVFVANPAILVLDDATSAVDVETETHIHQAIKNHTSTILIIAHRLSTIALADRILLLDDGVIVDSGTHQELLANNNRYREILAETIHQKQEPETNESETNGAASGIDVELAPDAFDSDTPHPGTPDPGALGNDTPRPDTLGNDNGEAN